MRVGVDGRRLAGTGDGGLRQARGIARYTERLLAALARSHPGDEFHVLVPGAAGQIHPDLRRDNVVVRRSRLDGRLARAAAAVAGRPRLDRMLGGELDVLWLPAPAPAALSQGVPYVLTLHDLSFISRPGDLSRYERLWSRALRPARLARRAEGLIAVSEATRGEAVARLGIEPAGVEVIPSGAPEPDVPAPHAVEEVRRRHGLPESYHLFVGALEPRKAPDLLVRAHAEARNGGARAGLVLAGDGPLRTRLDGPGVHLLGRVPDADLAPLYAGALATVLPSHLEGFGFTPLESIAAGTPAVVSDLPALRETLGEGALFVPPGDVAALARALVAIEGDPALRARLVEAGRAAAARLSWDTCAHATHAVLARAAGS